jgi:hypothetical protein
MSQIARRENDRTTDTGECRPVLGRGNWLSVRGQVALR